MKFLNQLSRILKGYFRNLFSREELSDDDSISRFIFTRSHYRSTAEPNKQVKPDAFLPYLNKLTLWNFTLYKRYESSIFVTKNLNEAEIWGIGEEIAEIRTPSLKARADLTVNDINQSELLIDFNNDPPKHADIIGWPKAKEERIMQALILASRASLVIYSH